MSATPSSSKAGLAAGCVSGLVTVAVLGVVHYNLLAAVRQPGPRLALAVVSAVLLGLGLLSFWHLARGFGRTGDSSLQELLRRARSGETPGDGEAVIATGAIRALGEPLLAPLSGTPCVFYLYRMYYVTVRNTRSGHDEVPVYWGYASRPFALEARGTRVRVLAVPLPEQPSARRSGLDAIERARRLVASTSFEAKSGILGAVGSALSMARDAFTDDDGEARRDWKREGDDRDPEGLQLEETLLPLDAEASAHGAWSVERGAIVVGAAPGSSVAVVLGPPEKLAGVGGAPHTYVSYVVTAIVLTALGIGLVWFGARVFPTL
jgi:hypothetical protein